MEYPYEALREAIINALIHRKYLGTSNIQVRVYNDCIILMNEGKLPPEVPVDKLKIKHLSKPGNPLLADVFYKAGFIESWGRGTLEIVNKCIEQGLPEPDFTEEFSVFNLTLYKGKLEEETVEESVEESVEEIINLISENPTITAAELTKRTGLTRRSVEWNIKKLKDKGILKRVGPTKGGRWEVEKKKPG